MIASFNRPEESKEIYFALSNSFQLANPLRSPTYKIAGLYAIFNKDVCLYVGQSKNVPSRLSTHLTGRYETVDRVEVYFICEERFGDFYERNKQSQTLILENNEQKLINTLKPTENILVDRGDVSDELAFESLLDEGYGASVEVIINDFSYTVFDDPYHCLEDVSSYVFDRFNEMIASTRGGPF